MVPYVRRAKHLLAEAAKDGKYCRYIRYKTNSDVVEEIEVLNLSHTQMDLLDIVM